jgi:hypothetical protein
MLLCRPFNAACTPTMAPPSLKPLVPTISATRTLSLISNQAGIIRLLMIGNRLHLGRTRTRRIKFIPQPLLRQPAGKLESNDALAHAENLRIVGQDGALDAEGIVRGHGADSRDLVPLSARSSHVSTLTPRSEPTERKKRDGPYSHLSQHRVQSRR